MKSRISTQDFISKAQKVHGARYSYEKTNYFGADKKLIITCNLHGDFEQTASNHIDGSGCHECGKNRKTTASFIYQAEKIHKKKYSYEKTLYKSKNEKVTIICHKHGEFSQVAREHLRGSGCKLCGQEPKLTTEQFIKLAKRMHGKEYSYEYSKYINADTKVDVFCPKHGVFKVNPKLHIAGKSCPACTQGYLGSVYGQVYVLISNVKGIGKIGITGSSSDRIGKHCEQGFDLLVKLYQFNNGLKSIELESQLKAKFPLRFASKDDVHDGHTETFSIDILEDIIQFCDLFTTMNSGIVIAESRPTSEYLSIRQKRRFDVSSLNAEQHKIKKKWWQIF